MRVHAGAADLGADWKVNSTSGNSGANKSGAKPTAQKSRLRNHRSGRPPKNVSSSEPPAGLAAREMAVDLITAVLQDHRTFDETLWALLKKPSNRGMESRDLGLARAIASNTLRFAQPLDEIVARYIEKPLPAKQGRVAAILLSATTQLLILKTPAHAAISLAVDQTKLSRQSTHLAKFVNAVLRKVSQEDPENFAGPDLARRAIPEWLFQSWVISYGEETAAEIATASLSEAPLDLTLKDPGASADWSKRLRATSLATGSLRLCDAGRVDELSGFKDGAWWVQDAAAALPARLLPNISGMRVADLCAAPGGKTAQLAASGAIVTAVDQSASRLVRLKENLVRLDLTAELVEADASTWQPGRQFDAVLIDAPCTATGTIRRHPDILHLKRGSDIEGLAALQKSILDNAATLVRAGGTLVYCTCSLQPEEGEAQAADFLACHPDWECVPIVEGEAGIPADWLTSEGHLRTLPSKTPSTSETAFEVSAKPENTLKSGMDGFFAARLTRRKD